MQRIFEKKRSRFSVSTACPQRVRKVASPLFGGSAFGQPEVARRCKEWFLQAKSTAQQGAVFIYEDSGREATWLFQRKANRPAAKPSDTNESRRDCGPSDTFLRFFDSLKRSRFSLCEKRDRLWEKRLLYQPRSSVRVFFSFISRIFSSLGWGAQAGQGSREA